MQKTPNPKFVLTEHHISFCKEQDGFKIWYDSKNNMFDVVDMTTMELRLNTMSSNKAEWQMMSLREWRYRNQNK